MNEDTIDQAEGEQQAERTPEPAAAIEELLDKWKGILSLLQIRPHIVDGLEVVVHSTSEAIMRIKELHEVANLLFEIDLETSIPEVNYSLADYIPELRKRIEELLAKEMVGEETEDRIVAVRKENERLRAAFMGALCPFHDLGYEHAECLCSGDKERADKAEKALAGQATIIAERDEKIERLEQSHNDRDSKETETKWAILGALGCLAEWNDMPIAEGDTLAEKLESFADDKFTPFVCGKIFGRRSAGQRLAALVKELEAWTNHDRKSKYNLEGIALQDIRDIVKNHKPPEKQDEPEGSES